jgi:hypothetical protein
MRTLRRVELSGMNDGRRAVRLVHGGGETRAVYREGACTGEAVLALHHPGGPWEELALGLAGGGVGSLLLPGGGDESTGLRAGLDFLRQRGTERVLLAGEGTFAAIAAAALRTSTCHAAGLALLFPLALVAEMTPADVPSLVVVNPALELLGRRIATQIGRCELARVRDRESPELPPLLRTFALDALSGSRCAIGG